MTQHAVGLPWQHGRAPVSDKTLHALDAYWRCANYLSVGQIYLRSNPVLNRPLSFEDVKPRPIGHWGTIPGLNFLYAHINRLVAAHSQSALVVMGPGHGGPAGAVSALVDGTFAERYPWATDDERGLAEFMRAYSAPRGMPSNCTPVMPGSIHTGGELGYTLSHAFGAALDNPGLLAVPIVGDGEAEEAAIAAAWSTVKLMSPQADGVVLPVLHMNGYKITTPSILAASSAAERAMYFRGLGYEPFTFSAGFEPEDPLEMHRRFAELLEDVYEVLCRIREQARRGVTGRMAYPLVIFQSPKGWTTPAAPDGTAFDGSVLVHELPLRVGDSEERLRWLEGWLKSYRPEELFTSEGAIAPEVRSVAPRGDLRLGANPAADGGRARVPLDLPPCEQREVLVDAGARGAHRAGLAGAIGAYTRDVMRRNPDNFRLFSPDELSSNRMDAALEVTGKQWDVAPAEAAARTAAPAASGVPLASCEELSLAPSGKVLEVLSEHQCEGLLEGYVLTGRHGIWATYESFAQVTASMVGQHCKWLEETARYARWRAPIPSLNILLTSHVWRQDHNGFSHQDPSFADVVFNKNCCAHEHVANIYYPADANMALAVARRCYESANCVNAIVAGKQESPVYQTLAEAEAELAEGAAVWGWASSGACEKGASPAEPDLVVASAGDVVTAEALAATQIMQGAGASVRFVNVVDPLCLMLPSDNDRALSDERFSELFGRTAPVLFCFHGYEGQLWRLIAKRPGVADRLQVHGYRDQGATTTPYGLLFDNCMDRFELAADGLLLTDRRGYAAAVSELREKRAELMDYTVEHGVDHPSLGL